MPMFKTLLSHAPYVGSLIAERDQLREQLAGCDCLPVPPPHLRFRIGADTNLDKFLGIGRTLLGDIKILAAQAGREFDSFQSILDFGCGCGRVIRHLGSEKQKSIFGTDIDPEAIDWCRDNLKGVAEFSTNPLQPPLKYADSSFDLIYGISVFTHLPEDIAMIWLAELRRILKPDGVLVTSTIGASDLNGLMPDDKEAQNAFMKSGFYYTTRFKTEGLPTVYGLAFHDRSYIERMWSQIFTLSVYRPQAINNHQCGIVLRLA